MQASAPAPSENALRFNQIVRGIAWFLLVPLLAVIVLAATAWWTVTRYEQQHAERIYTGVAVGEIELGGMTQAEAAAHLAQSAENALAWPVTLVEPLTGLALTFPARELGVTFEVQEAVAVAYEIGRNGSENDQWRDRFNAWYRGHTLPPRFTIESARLQTTLNAIAEALDRDPVNASIDVSGSEINYHPPLHGARLDYDAAQTALINALTTLQPATVTLALMDAPPQIGDLGASAAELQQLISGPATFYLEKPADGSDLQAVTLEAARLLEWVRIEYSPDANGELQPHITLDDESARAWISQFAPRLARDPARARFYFDDYTDELVLVESHQNGRYLDVEATLAALQAAVRTPNRSLPFVVRDIVPTVHAGADGEELGITELVAEATTYFAGSPPERMHNIARSAASFYGIVVAPGEQFSFNHYLGEISEEQGYTRGLIIAGGRTIEGIGGGVCQVSTTVFQAAFVGGFQLDERWQHGYRVQYYESGLGVGLDAAVYSPDIDLRFTNDTPYHLLIENYYNEATQSLTFKFYSTGMGRTVTWTTEIWGERPPRPDLYEYNAELEGNQLELVDWAVEGAKVLIKRTITNRWGETKLLDEPLYSDYIPWANIYQYGPDYVFPTPTPPPAEPPVEPPAEESGEQG